MSPQSSIPPQTLAARRTLRADPTSEESSSDPPPGSVRTLPVQVTSTCVIGGRGVVVIAGPCSVESAAMLTQTARSVRSHGATMLRGGAFKPRTSPHAFRGLGADALPLLADARAATGLPVVTEVMDPRQVEVVSRYADMLQIGTRNMQNFSLLAEVGRSSLPVLLKRGMAATIRELLYAAEHVMAAGNGRIVLCERGIRTFETSTRSTLDVSAVPVLKQETHLPVLVDPSHAAGAAPLVRPLALAAIAAGADGLLVEVHPEPAKALSDGEQSLGLEEFAALMSAVRPVAEAIGRWLATVEGTDERPSREVRCSA